MTLKERMAKATGKAGVDLNPQDYTPPPSKKKEEEVLPDAREVIPSIKDRNLLNHMVSDYLTYSQQESEAKKAKKPLNATIKKLLGTYQVSKVMVGDNRVNYYNAPRRSIKAELLLQAGVPLSVIEKCTVATDAYTLKITPPGSEDEDD